MISFKLLLVIAFCSQQVTHTLADSNVTDDAQAALTQLYDEIEKSTTLVNLTVPSIWSSNVSSAAEIILQKLTSDIANFTVLVSNITQFAENVTNATDCLSPLEIFLDIANYRADVISSERGIYENLVSLANIEINNVAKQFNDLSTELNIVCLQNRTNCDGISESILAEVDRLVPIVRRIPYELIAEVHLLGYRFGVNWETVQVILMMDYNKVIQNATICLAASLENYDREVSDLPTDTSNDVKESILDSYEDLLNAAEDAYITSIYDLLNYTDTILDESLIDFDVTIFNIRNVTLRANVTVNALLQVARSLNVTANCTTPDLLSIINSYVGRSLNEYSLLLNVLDNRYVEGLNRIEDDYNEVDSFQPQIDGCLNISGCEYISKKIARKTYEIPLVIQRHGNATAALLYQTVTAVRESGSKIVREVVEQLEVGIINLKTCVQTSLY